MQNDIKKAIEDIYINGNTELFISKCRDTVARHAKSEKRKNAE